MRLASEAIWKVLHSGLSPIVIVLYGQPEDLRDVVEQVETIAHPEWMTRTVRAVLDAVQAPPSILVLLLPTDEVQAMTWLERYREQNLEREQPIVLFLQRDGAAHRALADLPNLRSWVAGSVVDPEWLDIANEEDVREMREEFQRDARCSPEQWLSRYRQGELPNDAETTRRTYRALFLEA